MSLVVALLLLIVLLLVVLFLVVIFRKNDLRGISGQLRLLQEEVQRIELSVRSEISGNRREANEQSSAARRELGASLLAFEEKLSHLTSTIDAKLAAFNEATMASYRDNRLDMRSLRETLEKKMADMSAANEKRLEQMRQTVDEKLQQTLEARLGESFRLVSERLEAVHKGLGDMQQLATGVGDLKRVLSNVKTRGVLGEYQLANLLEQLLTPEQYGRDVKTRAGSNAHVEFAVKMPGRNHPDGLIWLPIDSKFPKDQYDQLQQAYDEGLPDAIEQRRNSFIKSIKKCAFDIADKYLDTPQTTNFAILFLPFESLYAEVLREPGLFENLRHDYGVIITGPTTLAALLNSLQVGFHTLAIEKRSSEVWQLLSAVKTEFAKFGDLLQKAQSNIQTGLHQLDDVMGKRTRAIQKKLRAAGTNGDEEAKDLLSEGGDGRPVVE